MKAHAVSFAPALLTLACVALTPACPTTIDAQLGGAEGEGEGEAAGEGEGEAANAGEGEGEPNEGEGESNVGELVGEGEGESNVGELVGEGEGEDLGGEGEGESIVDACSTSACPSAPTSTISFTFGSLPSASVNGTTITVGTSSRSNVEGQLGAGQAVDDLGFRVRYCNAGIEVQYVDSDGTFDGPSSGNKVARIVTLADANASGGGFTIGSNPPLLGANPQIFGTAAGAVIFDGPRGLEAIVDANGVITGLVAFRAQDAGTDWDVGFALSGNASTFGGVRAAGQDIGNGDSFGNLENVIGDNFDTEGIVEVDVSGFTVEVHVRVYAALGIRVAGACGFDGCDDNDEISSISLSPPYAGSFNGVTLGDTRSDVEQALGAGGVGPDANGMVAYSGFSSDFGVRYTSSGPCANRAGAFVLGYDPP